MHLEFSYNKEEVLNALRYHFLQRGEIKVFRNTLFILLSFTLLGYAYKLVTVGALVGIAAMIVIIILVFWYMLPVSIYNKAATFKDNIHLNYSEEGIVITSRSSETERQWSWKNFTQVVEAKNFFFLYRGKKNFFLVPTSAFKSGAAQKEVRQLAEDKIN